MFVTPASRAFVAEHPEHLGLDVGGVDGALGPDPARQADAVVAGPGADVGDGRARGGSSGRRASPRAAPPRSRVSRNEPVGALPRHHVGDRPAHVEAGRIAAVAGLGGPWPWPSAWPGPSPDRPSPAGGIGPPAAREPARGSWAPRPSGGEHGRSRHGERRRIGSPAVRAHGRLPPSVGEGVADDAVEGLEAVLRADLLALAVVAAVVADRDLVDPAAPRGPAVVGRAS